MLDSSPLLKGSKNMEIPHSSLDTLHSSKVMVVDDDRGVSTVSSQPLVNEARAIEDKIPLREKLIFWTQDFSLGRRSTKSTKDMDLKTPPTLICNLFWGNIPMEEQSSPENEKPSGFPMGPSSVLDNQMLNLEKLAIAPKSKISNHTSPRPKTLSPLTWDLIQFTSSGDPPRRRSLGSFLCKTRLVLGIP